MCWPANVVGAFFIAVLIFDMVEKKYGDLPYHAIAGVVLTFLFWLICSFVSVSVSAFILIVPAIFICVFLFTIWFMNESLKQRGCCMNCNGNCGKKGYLVKKTSSAASASASASPASKAPEKCIATLTASTV